MDGLRALDRTGLLVRAIPEWADVRCRPQRDPYHRYTVDMHLLRAFERTSRALAAPDAEDPVEVVAVDLVRERDGVLLGALLHDVGKNGEGGHVAVGDRLASGILERMGVEGSTRALATFMVAQHLLLPDTATRRDLGDDDLILDVAARIETPERLAALFLLAKADALATGPAAWTPWRQTLIRELVAKVRRVLERGEMGVEVAERLTDAIGRVRDLLHDEDAGAVERFIMRMPRSYFLSIPPAQVAQHYATIAPDLGRHDVRTSTWPSARAGHLRAAGRRGRPAGPALVDRGGALPGRALHPDGAGVHHRGRCGRGPVRGAGRVRARGGRGAVARVPARRCARRSTVASPWSIG